MSRTYAEEQADRCLDLLACWFYWTRSHGGIWGFSEADVYGFARIASQVHFHAEREQVPEVLVNTSRAENPFDHALWEACSIVAWNETIVGRDPQRCVASTVKVWLNEMMSVVERRARYYSNVTPSHKN